MPVKKISEAEIQMGIAARRSIVAMRDLPAGTVLTVKDLDCIRPHNGLPPSEVNSLIGKKLVAAVKYHDLLLDVSIQNDLNIEPFGGKMTVANDQKKSSNEGSTGVANYYDSVAQDYSQQYQRDSLASGRKYPQNYYRLQKIVQRLGVTGAKSVYEVGVGEGTPLAMLAQMGFQVAGCDISEKMVELTREHMKDVNVDPVRIQWADIEDSLTLANQAAYGPFDALIALGVMPHVAKDNVALGNMRMFLRKGSRVHIEFRNKLFSLFTFNRLTKEFILDDLLEGVSDKVKAEVAKELDQRLAIDQPKPREGKDGQKSYDSIRARFHNPFEVTELMESVGFTDVKLNWYHYHSAMPMIEDRMKKEFWEEASRMEHGASWRGYFLCSAFWVEAEVA